MNSAERDARLKLLLLQGALYRLEIIQARSTLKDAAKPRALVGQVFELLKFLLAHKRISLIATAVPWVFGRSRVSRLLRRGLLTLGAAGLAWLFLKRQSQA